ncbi:MAG: poly-beta-1,6 N-acetyl-D-glucosamine synthase [Verrucomicrobia bacterium]|nr:poly-beta-1,6 N-acetyl-D-glucosamine synthase [Verrucomicrobiota bacterium]
MKWILSFVYHYPLFMAFAWVVGSLVYRLRRIPHSGNTPPELSAYPGVSVLIPCHNEGKCIRETIEHMVLLEYPEYEVIVIDDGSSDDTLEVLKDCARKNEKVRVISLAENQGKATALKMGLLASRHEYLVCVDADAFLDKLALRWIMWHFVKFPRVGAVTGNPRIRNRTSLLGKIQVGEYSTIIGMIKRTQRIMGKVFTISGVTAAFRKRALLESGLWSDDMVTEDIDVSWKLQSHFWDIRFEEKALCWILTPESLTGLWHQRLRWAQGGAEVAMKYFKTLLSFKQRRLWPIFIEYVVSAVWAYALFFTLFIAVLNVFVKLPEPYSYATILPPEWSGTFLACVCMMQALAALFFERKIERGMPRYIFWFVWYPMIYWLLSATATAIGWPMALFRKRGRKAIWNSPDRGLEPL